MTIKEDITPKLREKRHMLLIGMVIVGFILSLNVNAQDVSFSQMYATPMYLSPSFTGLTQGTRLGLTYRDQWPGITNTYRSYALSVDHFFDEYSSGLGLMVLRDDNGGGLLVRQDISALYAYEIEVARDIFVRPGIEFSY
ncbi:MAG: type IX secretion system membrane protein PorP/SprF, partial [Bacteroidales bacterium]|nr:type IX secretion system membrane protein PorP/SprF [Bacteroidales bacterium]